MATFAKIGMNGKVIDVQTLANEVLHDSNGVEREDIGVDFFNKINRVGLFGNKHLTIHTMEFITNLIHLHQAMINLKHLEKILRV